MQLNEGNQVRGGSEEGRAEGWEAQLNYLKEAYVYLQKQRGKNKEFAIILEVANLLPKYQSLPCLGPNQSHCLSSSPSWASPRRQRGHSPSDCSHTGPRPRLGSVRSVAIPTALLTYPRVLPRASTLHRRLCPSIPAHGWLAAAQPLSRSFATGGTHQTGLI